MVSPVGNSVYSGQPSPAASITGDSVAALEGRVTQDQMQLQDWTTCVSAKTTKGQAAIQKLSGEISAVKEQIARALQTSSSAAAPSATGDSHGSSAHRVSSTTPRRPGTLDTWA